MIQKSSALVRLKDKWLARQAKKKAKDAVDRQVAKAWSELSAQVRTRDKGCCRVCHKRTIPAGDGNPEDFGQAHHIIYRSAGGPDELWNLVWLCNFCHDAEHVRRTIDISGTASKLVVKPGPFAKAAIAAGGGR